MYSNNPTPSHLGIFPIIDNNRLYITDAPVVQNSNAPLYIRTTICRTTQQNIVIAKHNNAIYGT